MDNKKLGRLIKQLEEAEFQLSDLHRVPLEDAAGYASEATDIIANVLDELREELLEE